tara:strand:- start:11164 stop:11499 length:336 start_codon:yes stop_codon:yes gene_type:complete
VNEAVAKGKLLKLDMDHVSKKLELHIRSGGVAGDREYQALEGQAVDLMRKIMENTASSIALQAQVEQFAQEKAASSLERIFQILSGEPSGEKSAEGDFGSGDSARLRRRMN